MLEVVCGESVKFNLVFFVGPKLLSIKVNQSELPPDLLLAITNVGLTPNPCPTVALFPFPVYVTIEKPDV